MKRGYLCTGAVGQLVVVFCVGCVSQVPAVDARYEADRYSLRLKQKERVEYQPGGPSSAPKTTRSRATIAAPSAQSSNTREMSSGSRWAVVIGLSESAVSEKRECGSRDAERFAAFLGSEAGGGVPASQIRLLSNKEATKGSITDALFEFLKQTDKDDVVVIFFSGLGRPDPEEPLNLYLMAYDTDPTKLAATGIPVRSIDSALRHSIPAERIVLFMDVSRGRTQGDAARQSMLNESFNRYFESVAKSKPGVLILTSCEGNEVSQESESWGGGHGIFTWAILEGLSGKADTRQTGTVTLGDLVDYVDTTVRRETGNAQHPTRIGAQFDRDVPLAIVK